MARHALAALRRKVGTGLPFYPSGKVWAPWNLICEDCCTLADHAEIYNPSPIYLESHCIVSQQAFLCGATHDYNDPDFPMISYGMRLGAYSWICARASVSPGVQRGRGRCAGTGLRGIWRPGALDGVQRSACREDEEARAQRVSRLRWRRPLEVRLSPSRHWCFRREVPLCRRPSPKAPIARLGRCSYRTAHSSSGTEWVLGTGGVPRHPWSAYAILSGRSSHNGSTPRQRPPLIRVSCGKSRRRMPAPGSDKSIARGASQHQAREASLACLPMALASGAQAVRSSGLRAQFAREATAS